MLNGPIAVLGCGGLIGRNLCEHLVEQGRKVLGIGRSVPTRLSSPLFSESRLDVAHTEAVLEATQECDAVVWLANSSVPATNTRLPLDFKENIAPLIDFATALAESKRRKRFVYLSSGGTVYGNSGGFTPITELFPASPISLYGVSKLVAETYLSFAARSSECLELSILRPSNVYGPGQVLNKSQGIVGFAFEAARTGANLDLVAGGSVVRDFVYVDDLCQAIRLCLDSNRRQPEPVTYNVGSQVGTKISEVVALIESISGSTISCRSRPERTFDVGYNVLDISKIQSELGWAPTTPLTVGLKRVWEKLG